MSGESMTNVLVTGAAGGLGHRLVARLREAGFRVIGSTLPGDPLRKRLDALGCEVREADVGDAATLRDLCEGIDVVYHLAAVIVSHDPSVFRRVNLDGTVNVLRAAAGSRVRHFVYVSSASVTYPSLTPYAQSKLAAENAVKAESSLAHTIVRPTLVYDASGNLELSMFADSLLRYPVVPFIGDGRAVKRPVWSEDLVDGLARMANNPIAFSKTYNLSGAEPITMGDFARLILEHRGVRKRFVHLPVPLCKLLARAAGLAMQKPPLTASAIAGVIQDADLDPTEAMRDLGYRPIGVREGFRRCFPLPASAAGSEWSASSPTRSSS